MPPWCRSAASSRSHRIAGVADRSRCAIDAPAARHGMVGDNVQAWSTPRHHLIVAHEVINEGHDRSQLTAMAQQTDTLQTADLKVLADRGYFSGEIMKCEQAGVTPLVPKPLTNNAATTGRFDKRDFHYDAKRDRYTCPAGNTPSGGSPRSRTGWALKSTGRPPARRARSAATARRASIGG